MNKRILVLLITVSVLSGCANMKRSWKGSGVPDDLARIENMSEKTIVETKKNAQHKIRLEAIRDTALSLGARSGLAWRMEQINLSLKERTSYLDQVFNFRSLVLNDNVLPPVLVESRQSLNMENPHSIRIADSSYKIVKQARFVTAVPNWRNYLIMRVKSPEMPDVTLLPQDSTERSEWRKMTRKGWNKGIEQANRIYVENLNRLKRDYQGMIRYRTLLAQNMVSPPLVAKRDLGVTGGGEELSVNDRILTIKALPSLKADSHQWRPKVTH